MVPQLDGDTELMSAWRFLNAITKIEWLLSKGRMEFSRPVQRHRTCRKRGVEVDAGTV
jgi:hypothetical protein